MILIISVVDTALMTLPGAAHKVLARSGTTHHPLDLRLRLELLLLVEIMIGLDH